MGGGEGHRDDYDSKVTAGNGRTCVLTLRLIPGMRLEAAVETLRQVEVAASNVRSAGHSFSVLQDAYLSWAVEGSRQLRACFQSAGVETLILATRYWHLQTGAHASEKSAVRLIEAELYEVAGKLEAERTRLQSEQARWQLGRLVVLDTSALIHGPRLWDWNPSSSLGSRDAPIHIVVPILVLDELDALKESSKQHTRQRARETLRWIEAHVAGRSAVRIRQGGVERADGRVAQVWGDVFLEVRVDEVGHTRLPIPDDEIVDGARAIQDLAGRRVLLVTNDTAQAYRARLAEIDVSMVEDPVYDIDLRESARREKEEAKQRQRDRG